MSEEDKLEYKKKLKENDKKIAEQLNIQLKNLNTDLTLFQPYQQKLEARTNLDLMIIMDCTYSMDPWINVTIKELKSVID